MTLTASCRAPRRNVHTGWSGNSRRFWMPPSTPWCCSITRAYRAAQPCRRAHVRIQRTGGHRAEGQHPVARGRTALSTTTTCAITSKPASRASSASGASCWPCCRDGSEFSAELAVGRVQGTDPPRFVGLHSRHHRAPECGRSAPSQRGSADHRAGDREPRQLRRMPTASSRTTGRRIYIVC